MKDRYICIEGNIGAGKTTLAQMLADELSGRLVLESFEDNPFLPIFYKDPARFAFPVELHFLMERHKQLKQEFSNLNLFSSIAIADYCPHKSLIFANQTLEDSEYRLFKSLYQELMSSCAQPDIIFYINRPKEWLIASIQKRGRTYELEIELEYLNKVQSSYLSMFHTVDDLPIVWINAAYMDFKTDHAAFNWFCSLMSRDFPRGLSYLEAGA